MPREGIHDHQPTVVVQVDAHGKLIAIASTCPVKVVLLSNEPNTPAFGMDIIDGPTSCIPHETVEIAHQMHRQGNNLFFHEGKVTWRYNHNKRWWEAIHNNCIILHVEGGHKNHLPSEDSRALVQTMVSDEFIQ